MELELATEEIWQVETGGQVFNANLDEIAAWIEDGSLLRIDRVRKGNLRWIEAGKVPALDKFFNAKDATAPPPRVITISSTEVLGRTEAPRAADADRRKTSDRWYGPDRREVGDRRNTTHSRVSRDGAEASIADIAADVCSVHTDAQARYVCDTCTSLFCKACPTGYGSNVKICPFCGAMCSPLEPATAATGRNSPNATVPAGSFGFGDFGRALAYPFRFKSSLVFGAILFAIFQIAQGGGPFGGIFMMAASLTCFMLSNMLTFGVMANTVDNFAKGEAEANFMPSFEDFDIWDDVVHPFFLSIGVYISAFGPFIAMVLFAIFFVAGGTGGVGGDAAAKVDPAYAAARQVMNQGQAIQQLVANSAQAQQRRTRAMQEGNFEQLDGPARQQAEDERLQNLDKMIQDQQRTQLESAVGKTPETTAKEQEALVKRVMGYSSWLLIAGALTLLWGLIYFPAACTVAGYTRSFAATLNLMVGLDTIKRLGGSYFLILVMCLMLALASGLVNMIVAGAFAAFDMPSVGNLPAKLLGSLAGFYVWAVFSCILGFALYRSSDKLALAR